MLKRLWEYFLLTMGVTPKGAERAAPEDKWASGRRLKEQEEREQRAREEREDREPTGHPR